MAVSPGIKPTVFYYAYRLAKIQNGPCAFDGNED
jgi:hypothetical protein